jgi:hypothetical protein
MNTLVECDRAHDKDKTEIHIRDATSGANGYFCISCGLQMEAVKGRRRNHHFRHRPRFAEDDPQCIWASETHRHKIAKAILKHLRCVRVPALHALPAPDYDPDHDGLLPCLLKVALVEAAVVLDERCVFEDNQGAFRLANELEFDQAPNEKTLLFRPDIIFLDAQRQPILFIEICATHTTDEEKIARMKRVRVPCIEIRVLPTHFEADIKHQFLHSTTQTEWLYHPQQSVYDPNAYPAQFPRRRGGLPARQQGRIFHSLKEIKCRTFRIRDAIRGVRKRLAGPEYAARAEGFRAQLEQLRAEENRVEALFNAAKKALGEEQAGIGREAAGIDDELRGAYRKAGPEVERRVGAKRQAYRRAETAVGLERDTLRRTYEDAEKELNQRFQAGTKRIREAEAAADDEFDRAQAELRAAETALRSIHVGHNELNQLEADLDREEADLAVAERIAQEAAKRERSALEQQRQMGNKAATGFTLAYRIQDELRERARQLSLKEEQANPGRLAL